MPGRPETPNTVQCLGCGTTTARGYAQVTGPDGGGHVCPLCAIQLVASVESGLDVAIVVSARVPVLTRGTGS